MTAEIAATAAADLLHEVASRRGGKRERRRADFVEKLDRYVGASTKLASEYAGVKSNVPRGRVGRAFASVSSALNGLTSEHEDMVIGRVLRVRSPTAAGGLLEHHLPRILVFAHAFERRCAHHSLARPLGELDLRHEFRLHEHGTALGLAALERARRPLERAEQLRQKR